MDIALKPGRYVVAVSGGVDSTALLHMLSNRPDGQYIVAHFDHGIRDDSQADRQHVQTLSKAYRFPFVYDEGRLGPKASEAKAREARYKFLHGVRRASGAQAIITAHHQDDLLETAILNLIRGTGRLGFSSLQSRPDVVRPLLHIPKSEILDYAHQKGLGWRDDPTNQDTRFLRNFVRLHVVPRLKPSDRQRLLDIINRMQIINDAVDNGTINFLHLQSSPHKLDRYDFTMLPHDVSREVMASWLRAHGVADFNRKTIERLVRAAKTFHNGRSADVNLHYVLVVDREKLALSPRDR